MATRAVTRKSPVKRIGAAAASVKPRKRTAKSPAAATKAPAKKGTAAKPKTGSAATGEGVRKPARKRATRKALASVASQPMAPPFAVQPTLAPEPASQPPIETQPVVAAEGPVVVPGPVPAPGPRLEPPPPEPARPNLTPSTPPPAVQAGPSLSVRDQRALARLEAAEAKVLARLRRESDREAHQRQAAERQRQAAEAERARREADRAHAERLATERKARAEQAIREREARDVAQRDRIAQEAAAEAAAEARARRLAQEHREAARRAAVLEPEVVAAVPHPVAPASRPGEVRLRCRACGHGNPRDAVACEACRALL